MKRTYLDWWIPVVHDLDSDPLATLVDHDGFTLEYNGAQNEKVCIRRWFVCREQTTGRDWQEGAVQRVCNNMGLELW